LTTRVLSILYYTDKQENKIFLIYEEIQKGAVAKSYKEEMRKCASIYSYMTRPFVISDCAKFPFI
jgi:hypothetical protein